MDLAKSLNVLNQCDESLMFRVKAIEIRERPAQFARSILGLSYGNLGRLFTRMNCRGEAESVIQQSIDIRPETMGPKSSKIAKCVQITI